MFRKHLPDILSVVGLLALTGGVSWRFGSEWGLIVFGVVLMTVGALLARREAN